MHLRLRPRPWKPTRRAALWVGTKNPTVTGTVAVTLANLTGAATGTETITGTVAVTLADFTANGIGEGVISGTAAVTLANLTGAAAGTEVFTGTSAQTLANFTSTATGTETITGTVAVTLEDFTGHATEAVALFATAVSANGRYVLDQNADPYFFQGNSPQNGVSGWDLTTWSTFFADQAGRGFNSSQIHAVYNFQADAETATDPFSNDNTLAVGAGQEDYWATLDSILDLAETNGVTVWLTVIDNISMGASIEANTSTGNCTTYGTFLGDRYKDRPNIVWTVGNDYDSSQWSARDAKYKAIIDAIRATGDTHLMTLWNNTEASDANSGWDSRNDLNLCYEYVDPAYDQIGTAYALSRTDYPKPAFWGEGTYLGEHNASPGTSTMLELRHLTWWPITWGGVGSFLGTHEQWIAGDWESELTSPIFDHLGLVVSFFGGLDGWEDLVPDTGHVFHTGGVGTDNGDPETSTFATAAFVNGGTLAVVYFPTSRGSITFDTSKLTGPVTAYWWDPTSGDTTAEASPAAPTHPGTNDGGDADWVLVFEGTPPVTGTVAVTLANVTSTATGTEVFTGTSARTLADFTATATGTETITGTVAVTLANFTATATGEETITGTSAQTLANFTASAVGTSTTPGTLDVTLTDFTASATGTVIFTGTAAPTLDNVTSTASGSVQQNVTGTVAVTLENFVCHAAEASIVGDVLIAMAAAGCQLTMTASTATLTMEPT